MESIKFNGFKLETRLIAQSPIIHFQPNDAGATVRASEMKPKLDRFLLKKISDENKLGGDDPIKIADTLRKMSEYKNIFISRDHIALDYKLQILCDRAIEKVEIGKTKSYGIYYGNMGIEDSKKKQGIFSDPLLRVICFKSKLKDIIEKYFVEFFYVTNFSTMQDKGFGSFIPEKLNVDEKVYVNWLRNDIGSANCFRMSVVSQADRKKRCIDEFAAIKSFYGIMKSGQNFGGYIESFNVVYMKRMGMDSDKKWMKVKGIAPNIWKPENEVKVVKKATPLKNAKYTRALLGISDTVSWKISCTSNDKEDITITNVDSDPNGTGKALVERIPSPVFFKVIGNNIYITASTIPDQIYGLKFRFQGVQEDILSTPQKSDFKNKMGFDIQGYLTEYGAYFNARMNKKRMNLERGVERWINATNPWELLSDQSSKQS